MPFSETTSSPLGDEATNGNEAQPISGPSWHQPDMSVLAETVTAAPTFPKMVLGEEWAEWCETVATGANAHFDYVAAALLGASAGLVGNSVSVGASDSFIQPAILWMCQVGRSGAGKTPATAAISDIVDDLDLMSERRHRLRDATVAAAVKLAAENPKGQLMFRDELSGMWDGIRRQGGEDFWLEAYNGKAFTKDRKNDEPLFVPKLSISVVGGAQPETIKGITTDGKNRGFSARWLFAYPEPVSGYMGANVEIDITWATAALLKLIALPVGCRCLLLSAAAQPRFKEWWDAKKREIADLDGLMAEWMQKQGGNALRVALILELLKWSATGASDLPDEIDISTMHDAIRLIDHWAVPMAYRTMEAMHRPSVEKHAASLAKHLRRAKLSRFNARSLRRGEHGPVGVLNTVGAMNTACDGLMEAGLIRFVGARSHTHAGRRSADYEVNPALLRADVAR